MARREMDVAQGAGQLHGRAGLGRLAAAGLALAVAAALALSLAGGAQPAGAAAKKRSNEVACAMARTGSGDLITITSCPSFLAQIGVNPVLDFASTASTPVTYNLDFLQLEGTDWWKPASHNLTLKGLAPGFHTIRYRIGTDPDTAVADYTWITPGAAPENVSIVHFGPANSKATITWTSQIPAWRTYCSVNGAPEVICRQAGLTLNGLPAGFNAITIRASNGPLDAGRTATILFQRESIPDTESVFQDGPWNWFPQT